MPSSSDRELRRQLEEPLNQECRNYPIPERGMLVTMLDTPYYPPLMADTPHYHNCMEIGLCIAGCGFVRLHEKVYPFSAGSIIVAPRGVHHNQEYGDVQMIYWRYLVINDDYLLRHLPDRYQGTITSFFDSIRETGLFLENSRTSGVDSVLQLMFDLRRRGDGESAQELELCVLLALQLIARHAESSPLATAGEPVDAQRRQPIEAALAYVYEHYKEDIQISELARSCSMSESYFRKQFLKIMGQSPLEYVNAYRVHRSMNLLRTTGDSIQNIAARSGFSSIAAFNRNFRQYAGVSPSEWRRERAHR
ncbi:MAG: helix-turn-helix domain-containing protein [Clostridia bacterium]|nr:helix-turn-helix domain-containing protein [Clostridia bacterium]